MCAIPCAIPFNLLFAIGANFPPEASGEFWGGMGDFKGAKGDIFRQVDAGKLGREIGGLGAKEDLASLFPGMPPPPPPAPPEPPVLAEGCPAGAVNGPGGAFSSGGRLDPGLGLRCGGGEGEGGGAGGQDGERGSGACEERAANGSPDGGCGGRGAGGESGQAATSHLGRRHTAPLVLDELPLGADILDSGATPSASSSAMPPVFFGTSTDRGVDGAGGGVEGLTAEEEQACRRACPGMVVLPRSRVEQGMHIGKESNRAPGEPGKVILVMSYDNIAALLVICALSILGAIYLWKIVTRRSCRCRLCQNQYRQLHLIGSGGYGSVYLVERLNDNQHFVSKKILVRNITEVDEYSKEAKELVTLRHRHIVSYEEDFVHVEYGALEPKTYFIIVMEYCPEGDLKEKIEQDFCGFTEEWVRTVFAQLLQAVQYLHSKNVIHRDLKSQNVFLAEDGHVRLGDFGLCRHTRNPGLGSATFSHAGTDCYMAPEMLSSSRYGKPADMWSLGCVLYELCTGQFMWELEGILGAMVMTQGHTVQKLVQENIAPAVGQTMRAFLRRLLSVKPEMRPTATACIRKKLFKRSFPVSREAFGDQLGCGTPGEGGGGSPEGRSDEAGSCTGFHQDSGAGGDGAGLDGAAGLLLSHTSSSVSDGGVGGGGAGASSADVAASSDGAGGGEDEEAAEDDDEDDEDDDGGSGRQSQQRHRQGGGLGDQARRKARRRRNKAYRR